MEEEIQGWGYLDENDGAVQAQMAWQFPRRLGKCLYGVWTVES